MSGKRGGLTFGRRELPYSCLKEEYLLNSPGVVFAVFSVCSELFGMLATEIFSNCSIILEQSCFLQIGEPLSMFTSEKLCQSKKLFSYPVMLLNCCQLITAVASYPALCHFSRLLLPYLSLRHVAAITFKMS